MAHEIEIKNGQAQMMYAKDGGVPWHGLGIAVEGHPSIKEAIRLAGLDWDVDKLPLYVHGTIDGKRTSKRVPGKLATVRVSDGEILGIVAEEYGVISNREAGEILDSVFQDIGLEAQIETAGSLRNGKEIFIAARIPKDVVIGRGDKQLPYLMLRTGHDGVTAMEILPTFIRPVCWNTVTMAVNNRGANGSDYRGTTLWHMGDIESKKLALKAALRMSIKSMDDFETIGNKLAEIPQTDAMVNAFLSIIIPQIGLLPAGRKSDAILPHPANPGRFIIAVPAERLEKTKARRETKLEIFRSVLAEEDGSAWGLFNAATGYADWQRPNRWSKGEAGMSSKLWGSGSKFKETAFAGIRELAMV